LKWVTNERHFTVEAEKVFVYISPLIAVGWLKYATMHSLRMRHTQCKLGCVGQLWRELYSWDRNSFSSHIPSNCCGVTEIWHVALPAHALQAEQVRLKSVINEGHFTLEAETVFRPYLPLHCSEETEIYYMALPTHVLRAVEVRLKSVNNEGYFTLQAERVSRPYHPLHWSVVIERCHISLPAHALRAVQCRLKSVSNEGHFILDANSFFHPHLYSHCCGLLKYNTLHFVRMRYMLWKLVFLRFHGDQIFIRFDPWSVVFCTSDENIRGKESDA
jgi:hypothetical protein